jgi:ParB family chromosome partitioning protein
MSEEGKTARLGRGLSALLGEDTAEIEPVDNDRALKQIPVEYLEPNPFQPRRRFDPEDLADLTASIKDKGVLQPIIVRRRKGEPNAYQIIAGERRWRAAQRAQLHEVPVIVRDLSDAEALEIAIIENVQRADLNPIEEANGYQALLSQFGHTQEDLGRVIGKSRSHISNTLRLLGLPQKVQDYLSEGQLSAGHARSLITIADPEGLAQEIVQQNLSVRETEERARESKQRRNSSAKKAEKPKKDADTRALENKVSDSLGLKVLINDQGKKGGDVRIAYKTLEQLDEICRRLANAGDRTTF